MTLCWIATAAGFLSAIFGIGGSAMLAVPYVRRQADRDAVDTLSMSAANSEEIAELYNKMEVALKFKIVVASFDDWKWGKWGCIALGSSFIFLLMQVAVRQLACDG